MKVKGLYLFCTRCSRQVSKRQKCPQCKGVLRYQSRLWNPLKQRTNITKLWPKGTTIREAIDKHLKFIEEVKAANYYYTAAKKEIKPTLLTACINMYLDWMQDIDVPEHEKKNLSRGYITARFHQTQTFVTCLKEAGYSPTILIAEIDKHHVGVFYEYLDKKGFKPRSFNAYMQTMKAFYWYLIDKKGYQLQDPFKEVKLRRGAKDPKIIEIEEFEQLCSVVSEENGVYIQGSRGKPANYYRDWLIPVWKFALFTGDRADGVFLAKWQDIENNYIKIWNWKINRKYDTEEYVIKPITPELAELLLELGMNKYQGSDKYIILPESENTRLTIKTQARKAFTHFWRLTGIEKDISFKHLRKTYLTALRLRHGDKAKVLGDHKSDTVEIEHYLNQKKFAESVMGEKLFDLNV